MDDRGEMRACPTGVVNLNKPLGWPSNRAVTLFRHLLGAGQPRRIKIGHAGTLDPLASGVLVLLVGRATRLAEMLMDAAKEYLAEVRLGATSTTDDGEGRIVPSEAAVEAGLRPTEQAVGEALGRFVGSIQQRPPAFSALRLGGRRAYRIARKSPSLILSPRTVSIYRIDLLDYRWPALRLRVCCGRGAYIRSLARDLGEALGVGGYLGQLERTMVGTFRLAQSVRPEHCAVSNMRQWLLGVDSAVGHLPRAELSDRQAELLAGWQSVSQADVGLVEPPPGGPSPPQPVGGDFVAGFDAAGELVALCRRRSGRLVPTQVFRRSQGG